MGVLIGDLPADGIVGGCERVPCYDGGATKSMTVDQIRDYVIHAIAGSESLSSFSGCVLLVVSGIVKKIDAETLVDKIVDSIAGDLTDADASSAKVFTDKGAASVESVVAGRLQGVLASLFGVSRLDNITPSDASVLFMQGGSVFKTTVSILSEKIMACFATWIITTVPEGDAVPANYIPVVDSSGNMKKITIAKVIALAGSVTSTGCLENNVPQWDSGKNILKKGLGVTTVVGPSSSHSDIPTAKAVEDAIEERSWPSVKQEVSSSSGTADVPSAKAVYDFVMSAIAAANS